MNAFNNRNIEIHHLIDSTKSMKNHTLTSKHTIQGKRQTLQISKKSSNDVGEEFEKTDTQNARSVERIHQSSNKKDAIGLKDTLNKQNIPASMQHLVQ